MKQDAENVTYAIIKKGEKHEKSDFLLPCTGAFLVSFYRLPIYKQDSTRNASGYFR